MGPSLSWMNAEIFLSAYTAKTVKINRKRRKKINAIILTITAIYFNSEKLLL
jgi:hypothetical protein